MTSQFSDMTSTSKVALFLLSSLVTGPSFMSISSLVLELWQFSFIRNWPEIRKSEIPTSEFFRISGDCDELWVLNLARMSLIECCWMLQNCRVTAFTVFELFLSYSPPAQIRINVTFKLEQIDNIRVMEEPVKGEWWVKTFTGQWPLSMAIWAWAVPVKCTWGIFSTTCTRHSLSNTPFSPSLCLLFLISTRLYRQKQAKILVKIYSKYIGCQLKQRRCCITPCYRYLSQLYHLKNWIFIKKILTNTCLGK